MIQTDNKLMLFGELFVAGQGKQQEVVSVCEVSKEKQLWTLNKESKTSYELVSSHS